MKKFSFLIILSLVLAFQAIAQNLKSAITAIGCKQIIVSELKPMSIPPTEFEA